MDKFIFGKNIKVIIDNVITEKNIKLTAEQRKMIIIKKVVTYSEIKTIKKRKVKEEILKSLHKYVDESSLRSAITIPPAFDSVKKYN